MAGRNQHHIPQFFQRGFGVRRSGKPKDIWEFTRDTVPEEKPIKETAAEFDFYSEPSADGSETLDDKITAVETPLARQVASLRALAIGSIADAATAAEVVGHLAPRTSHLRLTFAQGFATFMQGTSEVFGEEANIKHMLGFDADAPSALFQDALVRNLREDPRFTETGLPEVVLERVMFQLAKENFDSLFGPQVPILAEAMRSLMPRTATEARSGHNKALEGLLESDPRREDLAALEWTIEAAPLEGAILPDCVALGVRREGGIEPYMFVSRKDLVGVILPLATGLLIVGRAADAPALDLISFNAKAAACSHSSFLAHANLPEFAALSATLGDEATKGIDGAIEEVLSQFKAPVEPELQQEPRGDAGDTQPLTPPGLGYEVSFLDCADQATAERISEVIKAVVAGLSQVLPLGRLDGITLAADYPAALAAIDVGVAGVPAPTTVDDEVGTDVAMTVLVVRNDRVKARIVLAGGFGDALLDEAHPAASAALHILVHQLALVAMAHWVEALAPEGVVFKPWPDAYEGRHYAHVNAGVEGYIASRISGGFGDDDTTIVYRDLLVAALQRAQAQIPAERLAYRSHGDLDGFLASTYGKVGHILQFAGRLLGHCDAKNIPAFDDDSELATTLDAMGLRAWLSTFHEDLKAFWSKLGEWKSLDELLAFNRHLERILWQFAIFPWLHPEEGGRVEIPLAIDAWPLLAGMADGSIPTPEGFVPDLPTT